MTRHVTWTQDDMTPEYIENGLVTPKLDVFAIDVMLLELLSSKNAALNADFEGKIGEEMLYLKINRVFNRENVRENMWYFMDPCLNQE